MCKGSVDMNCELRALLLSRATRLLPVVEEEEEEEEEGEKRLRKCTRSRG